MEEVDDFLAHYGVTGMKWGVRKGSIKSRLQGAASDSVERRAVGARAIANGTAQTRDYRRTFMKTHILNTPTFASQKKAVKRADNLDALKSRVDSGKTGTIDKIGLAFSMHPADLVVSRRDKRALPGSPQDKVNSGRKKALKIVGGVAGAAVLTQLNNKQNRAVAVELLKMGLNSAVLAKQASNQRKASATARSNTHGLATGPTIRLQQNPTTGHWV